MKKHGPREGIIRTGPGEGFSRPGPGEKFRRPAPGEHDHDVEGHSVSDTLNRPIDGLDHIPSGEILGQPRTGGELGEERT